MVRRTDSFPFRSGRSELSGSKTAHENEACQRLVAMHGIGPIIATAPIAAIGN